MKANIDDLILLNMAGVGSVRLAALIEYFGDIEGAVKAGKAELQTLENIGPSLAERISGIKKNRGALKSEWGLVDRQKAEVFGIFDDGYPEGLKNIYDPPIVLYVRGRILKEDRIAVSLVGSRRASFYGISMCERLAAGLSRSGVTIVSGLARGIDSASHRGALSAGGRTLAVLGNGLNLIYPRENKRLAEEIAESGALISEFPMEMPPLPRNFPIRNRIISGLSLGVVIVEAAHKSGALITAECALEQGRDVFAVPGRAGTVNAKGTHRLIKNGAKLVDNVDDIIEELGLKPLCPTEMATQERLTEAEKKVCGILSENPEHIDEIMGKIDLPPYKVTKLLLELEAKKIVKELPGKRFVAI